MQLYLIAAMFVFWSGAITTTAYLKGGANEKAKAELVCINKLSDQDAKIADQKMEAAKIMAIEYKTVQATEQQLRAAKDAQEITDDNNKKTVDLLNGRVRSLAGIVGRLRDPNQATAGCGDGGSGPEDETPTAASNRQYNRAEAGGLLSVQLSGLLQERAVEADEINLAYISCRDDSLSIRAAGDRQAASEKK